MPLHLRGPNPSKTCSRASQGTRCGPLVSIFWGSSELEKGHSFLAKEAHHKAWTMAKAGFAMPPFPWVDFGETCLCTYFCIYVFVCMGACTHRHTHMIILTHTICMCMFVNCLFHQLRWHRHDRCGAKAWYGGGKKRPRNMDPEKTKLVDRVKLGPPAAPGGEWAVLGSPQWLVVTPPIPTRRN